MLNNLQTVYRWLFILLAMTTEAYRSHSTHRVRHGAVLALFALGVAGVTEAQTGGYENIQRAYENAKASHLGLRNISLDNTKITAETNSVGTAASSCVDQVNFSADRVELTASDPDRFTVYIKRLGEQALSPTDIESCIFTQTGLHATVAEKQ